MCTPNTCYSPLKPTASEIWIKLFSQTHSSRSSNLWPQGNKSSENILGRGPRRCESLHVRRKVPTGYNGAPQIRSQNTPSRGTIPKRHYCLIPGPVRPTMPNGIEIRSAVFHNALDRPTHRPTDRPRESLMTMARCAPRATRPNNR